MLNKVYIDILKILEAHSADKKIFIISSVKPENLCLLNSKSKYAHFIVSSFSS